MRLTDCAALVVCNVEKHQVAGVRGAHGGREADRIAHFTDHDDVRVLPQHVLERVMKRKRVQSHLALFDDALVVLEHVLDGVFQRDDVLFEVGVDVLDHRRQRGGFAATGGPGHQHDAARRFGDRADLLQQPEFLEARHLRFDVAHGQAPLAALLKQVRAEPPDAGHEIGKIDLALLLEALLQMRGSDCSTILFIHSSVGNGHSMATNWRLMRKMTGVPILR